MPQKRKKKQVQSAQMKGVKDSARQKKSRQSDNKHFHADRNILLKSIVFYLFIFFAGFIVHSRTVNYELVHCDDNVFVLDMKEKNASLGNVIESFRSSLGATYYRPILAASFVIDGNIAQNLAADYDGQDNSKIDEDNFFISTAAYFYENALHAAHTIGKLTGDAEGELKEVWGVTDHRIFHITNLFTHLFACICIFILFRQFGYDFYLSFFIGMIYVVHPVLTPAVSWISGRNDSLLTLFVVLSFIFLISYKNKSGRNNIFISIVLILLHLIFFSAAIFTKEIGGIAPAVFFFYLWLFRRKTDFSDSGFIDTIKKNYILAAGWISVIVLWWLQRHQAASGLDSPDTLGLDALIQNFPTVPALAGKIFLPVNMIALSSYEAFSIMSGIVFIGLAAFSFYFVKKINKSSALFGALWFVLFLFPTLLVRIIYVGDFFDYAEHRAYLVMIGFFIIIAEVLKAYKINILKPAALAVTALIFTAFTVRSFMYHGEFDGRKAFWGHMTEMYPWKSRGWYDLAKTHFWEKDYETAVSLYMKALERNPDNKNIYIDLSAVYINTKRYEKALSTAKKALDIDPLEPIANYNAAKSLVLTGRMEEALPYLEKAAFGTGKQFEWLNELGSLYFQLGMHEKAIEAYKLSVEKYPPTRYENLNLLGNALASAGRDEEALNMWERAVRLNPSSPQAFNNFFKFYFLKGEYKKATKYYKEILKRGGQPDQRILAFAARKGISLP